MNVDNILATAEAIEQRDVYFNQARFWVDEECKTPACIASHAVALSGKAPDGVRLPFQNAVIAAEWLGLEHEQSERLFYGNEIATRDQTVRTLRRLARTGKVRW